MKGRVPGPPYPPDWWITHLNSHHHNFTPIAHFLKYYWRYCSNEQCIWYIWDIWYGSKQNLYICCYVTIALPVQFPLSYLKCKLNSAKNTMWKWYQIVLPRLKRGFSGLRRLSDSQIIPLQIPIALYQTRRNGVIGEEQYKKNITKPCIIPLQVMNSSKVRQ